MTAHPSLTSFRALILTALSSITLALSGCGEQPAPEPVAEITGPAYNISLGMRDFMNLVLEPTADVLWESAGWVNSIEAGYVELYPTTDEQWDYVRQRAAAIVEIGNSLALPGRAVDNDAWLTYAAGLSNAGVQAMEAALVRDQEAFFQAGANLYSVCTACHQAYNPEISRFASN